MAVSGELQQTARRVFAGSTLAAAALVLAVFLSTHTGGKQSAGETHSGHSSPAPLSRLQQLSDRTARDGPVFSQLAQTTSLNAKYCDCSAPSPCVEVEEADVKKKFPGGGAAGLSGNDWGSWDPVTGVPRIDCPDTVVHAHCKNCLSKYDAGCHCVCSCVCLQRRLGWN